MTLIPAAGSAFDSNPFYVMHMILGETVSHALVFGMLLLEGKRLESKIEGIGQGRKVGQYNTLE